MKTRYRMSAKTAAATSEILFFDQEIVRDRGFRQSGRGVPLMNSSKVKVRGWCTIPPARLAFCKFIVKPSTLLVLDEPTNHLDIPTKEMLEEAIAEYKGTVITFS